MAERRSWWPRSAGTTPAPRRPGSGRPEFWRCSAFGPSRQQRAGLEIAPAAGTPGDRLEAAWNVSNLYNSCVVRMDQLAGLIDGIQPDRMGLTAFGDYAAASGRSLTENAGGNARKFRWVLVPDGWAGRGVRATGIGGPVESPAGRTARAAAGTAPCCSRKEIRGSGLRNLQAPMVSGGARYFPVYQEEWIRRYSEQAWRDAMEAWFRAE
jgi:hypothetical protein